MTVVHTVKPHRQKQTRCGINHARRGVSVTKVLTDVTCKSCIAQGPHSTYEGVTHLLHVDRLYNRIDRDTAACGLLLRIKFGSLKATRARVRGFQDLTCIACIAFSP